MSKDRGYVQGAWVCPRRVGMSKEGRYPGGMGYIGEGTHGTSETMDTVDKWAVHIILHIISCYSII